MDKQHCLYKSLQGDTERRKTTERGKRKSKRRDLRTQCTRENVQKSVCSKIITVSLCINKVLSSLDIFWEIFVCIQSIYIWFEHQAQNIGEKCVKWMLDYRQNTFIHTHFDFYGISSQWVHDDSI